MGLTDGHLAWGDDIPTESEKTFYRQIDNLKKENARFLKDCKAYEKMIEDIKSEINELSELDHIEPTYEDCKRDVLEIIDRHSSGAKMEDEK